MASFLRFARVVAMRTGRGFIDARGYDLASSLAYASLVSFVPLVVCVTVLGSTLFADPGAGFYRLIRGVVPGVTGELVANLQQLAAQARSVSGWATFFFLFTSLRMYFLLESAANALWGTTMHRRPLRRLGAAISVVVLGPVAAGFGTSLLLEQGARFGELRFSGVLFTCAILTLIYRIVPVAHIRWGPAVAAGFTVGTLIAFIKYELTIGVAALSGLSRIYGSISAVVILVLALGVVWTILLLGVSFAHALQFRCELVAHDEPEREARRAGVLDDTVRLLSVLVHAWDADRDVPLAVLVAEVQHPAEDVAHRLKQLAAAGLVVAVEAGGTAAEGASAREGTVKEGASHARRGSGSGSGSGKGSDCVAENVADEVADHVPDRAAHRITGHVAGPAIGAVLDRPRATASTSSGGVLFRLARSPEEISLYTVARAIGESVPRAVPIGDDPTSIVLRGIYRRADREVRGVLQGTSIRDVTRPRRERPR
jgi:YihY family inner membrane protein